MNIKNKTGNGRSLYWMYALIALVLCALYFMGDEGVTKEVTWTEFETYVSAGEVKNISVVRNENRAEAEISDKLVKQIFKSVPKGTKATVSAGIPSTDQLNQCVNTYRAMGKFKGNVTYKSESNWTHLLWSFGPIVLLIGFWIFMMRGMGNGGGANGGIFSVGKAKAQLFDKDEQGKITFKDVAGLSEAKVEVEELVHFLKNSEKYTKLGGRIPKGALLVGPPGTGKTLLAKAVAGEANVPFLSLSGSDFVEMFVGVGASRVRDLFRQAKEKAPCIVFIDEIDAVGRARGGKRSIGGNDERESTLNQMLTEMDGFGANSGVIVLAATNRADILDKALLRAGRFDRQIYVDLPELNDRKEIFGVHMAKIKTDDDVDIDLLARQTSGFSGADIANICNEGALIAARQEKEKVSNRDFMDAIDRVILGLQTKSKIITKEERKGIAIHEAGHATVSWQLQYCDPLVKVTIVPRGKTLGAAHYLPEERQLMPRQAFLDKICGLLGGRAAEELFVGQISSGALNDIERATKLATAMVAYYGMSKDFPNVSYYNTQDEYGFSKPYSDERAKAIDAEVEQIIAEQYDRAKAVLSEFAKGHNELADLLFSREVILTEDVEKIFGKRKWSSRTEETEEASKEDTEATSEEASKEDNAPTSEPTEEKTTEKKSLKQRFLDKVAQVEAELKEEAERKKNDADKKDKA